jgi:hypothetical protein
VNCAQFQEVVDDLARGTAANSGAEMVARAHADSCGECDRLLADAQHLNSMLLAITAADREAEMPHHSKASLLAAFHKQHLPKRSAPNLQTRWFAAIGLAAALLIGVVLYHFGGFESVRNMWTRNHRSPVIQNAAPAVADNQVIADDSSQTDAENVTSFVALPYADPWPGDDDEAVLRVDVPQSTLAAYGLPVTDANEQVTADFIVGEDGVPRAVRLVQ